MNEAERIQRLEEDLRRAEAREQELLERLVDAVSRIDEIERSVREAEFAQSQGPSTPDDEAVDYAPPKVFGDPPGFFVSPDEIVTDKSSPKRKSLSLMPETDGGVQMHEFHDAPTAGVIKVVRRGRVFVLVDPDGNTGKRKWMLPVRRDTGDLEIKWLLIGEDDSASDSSSQSASASESQSGSASDSGPCTPEILVEEVSGTTGHPNGGYKITVTHADCTQNEYYVWNGADGVDASGSGGSSMTCCEVRQCLAGLPAPHAISMSNNTITIQPRKYKASSGSDCIETENDGTAITFTIPTLPLHVPVTVLTDWTVSGTTVVTKKREINVVNPGNEQTNTIQGRSCEETTEGGD